MEATPIYEDLSDEDRARLNAQRTWVLDHYDDHSRADSVEGKLRLLDEILAQKWIESHETVKLQSLGVVFGDGLAQKLSLSWRMITDEYGRDPALVWEGTSIRINPLTMISKRIERGEEVDVFALFGTVCGHVTALSRDLQKEPFSSKSGQRE